jgi:hypothetical protein
MLGPTPDAKPCLIGWGVRDAREPLAGGVREKLAVL